MSQEMLKCFLCLQESDTYKIIDSDLQRGGKITCLRTDCLIMWSSSIFEVHQNMYHNVLSTQHPPAVLSFSFYVSVLNAFFLCLCELAIQTLIASFPQETACYVFTFFFRTWQESSHCSWITLKSSEHLLSCVCSRVVLQLQCTEMRTEDNTWESVLFFKTEGVMCWLLSLSDRGREWGQDGVGIWLIHPELFIHWDSVSELTDSRARAISSQ